MLFLAACGGADKTKTATAEPVMIYAAASLTDVLNELVSTYETEKGIKLQTNMASSGTLARQIEQGGTADLYISASQKWADYVESMGKVVSGNKVKIAENKLVLIAPTDSELAVPAIDSSLAFGSLLGDGRLSMGDPAHVPAGKYAKQSLEYFGWYEGIKNAMLPAKDVRSALMVVELGETPVGIVYRTDAMKSKKVKILNTFPEESHKPIVYVAELLKENKTSKSFYAFLNSEKAKPIWKKYGFSK